jgi:hypothetical protein
LEITNGLVTAVVQRPDAENGSYRGTRFDWAGIISDLRFAGHEYVGEWHDVRDPLVHDAVTGPAEEFITNDSALGYNDTPPGGDFPRIGIGAVRKPLGETKYQRFATYEIVNHGVWTIKQAENSITFRQVLDMRDGYAYDYTKTLLLVRGKPELQVVHILRNIGTKSIETSQYSHNFFVLDHQRTGPEVALSFGFTPVADHPMKFGAQVKGNQIVFTQELEPRQTTSADILGFGDTSADYNITLVNKRAGTSVHIRGDHSLEKLYFWAISTVACIEPYIHLSLPPRGKAMWRITYTFAANIL